MSDRPTPDFLWGTATSAFQIEGQTENDMTEWERLGRFKQNGDDPLVGDAVDHWRRWPEDFRLLRDLGVNSYRFSIEWSRLEREPGRFDDAAFDQYSQMIDVLRENEITPMVSLHHFSHPAWFHRECPWPDTKSVEVFGRFVSEVSRRLLDRVPFVVTLNEPLVWLLAGYGDAKFPPGERDLRKMMSGLRHMLLAHRRAYDIIKADHPSAQVGIAHNFIVFRRAMKFNPIHRHLRDAIHHFYNLMVPAAFKSNRLTVKFPLMLTYDEPVALDDRIDFWGVNYYYRLHVRLKLDLSRPFQTVFLPRSRDGLSDLGWEIYPKGLRKVCRWLSFTGKPLYITENGVAAKDDTLRVRFLKRHLRVLKRMRQEEIPVRGYFHWSLLDNYEWLLGTSARFGLYHVDYDDGLRRTLKPSGEYYRDYIRKRLADNKSHSDTTHQELASS